VQEDGSALFREGTQVVVIRSAKSSGDSWSPASVLKVIGATNFLVQYMHIGSVRELATEIVAAQYIHIIAQVVVMPALYASQGQYSLLCLLYMQ
jgi:hypothetical protein